MKHTDFFKTEIFEPTVKFAEEFSIKVPTKMNAPGRLCAGAATKKRKLDDVIEVMEELDAPDFERFCDTVFKWFVRRTS